MATSCVLRVIGHGFEADAFLAQSELKGAMVFGQGDPDVPGGQDRNPRAASGFNVPISQASFDDLDSQVRDALRFLRHHEDELRRLSAFPGVEEVCLDFGIQRREGRAQTVIFPAELLWHAGALDIDLLVTHYQIAEEPPLTPN